MNKKEAWFVSVTTCDATKIEIAEAQSRLHALQSRLEAEAEESEARASDYAAERAAEGANAVEGPDGALYMIRKMKKRKGGGDPPYAFALDPVKR